MAAAGASIRARMSDTLRAAGSRGKDKFLHLMYGEDLKRVQEEARSREGYNRLFLYCCGVATHFVKMDRTATPEPVCPFSGSKNLAY